MDGARKQLPLAGGVFFCQSKSYLAPRQLFASKYAAIVKCRIIDIDVYGDKVASGYKHVACLADENKVQGIEWAKAVNQMDGGRGLDIKTNMINDGTVAN